jgi:hypothetical protein
LELQDKEDDYNETDSLEEIDSDEQDWPKPPAQRRPNKERNHLLGHKKLLQDYFNEDCTYNNANFACQFCMRKELFLKIADEVENICPYLIYSETSKSLFLYHFLIQKTKWLNNFSRTVRVNGEFRAFTRSPWPFGS